MNSFENDVQTKRNDFIDSIVGFVVAFGFFAVIFILAALVDVFSII